ncbi:Psoralen synthase [Heracleum sosnowskyi]|uniref:Psoralen synthase n=1 Tax=Heracleum sosnowskyi TaxID=360622 RepID=A0AAD8N737_9APIA|nr:Psoralen synthase [Heracleum sosnowskyi]
MKMLEQNPLYLYFFSLFLVTIFLYKWLVKKTPSKNLPPSPPRLPIIGNLHQIGPDLHISLRDLARKYGPLMQLQFGRVPVLVVSSAEATREVLKTHDVVFSQRPITSAIDKLCYKGRDVAFSRYSEYWRQVRSTCVTQLLSNSRVHSFHNIREEEVALLIQNIENSASEVINLGEQLIQLTRNVVCRVSVGSEYLSGHKGKLYQKLLAEVTEMLAYTYSIGDFIPLLGWVDWLSGSKARVEKTAKEVDAFLEGALRDHIKTMASNKGSANDDFLSILLEIREADAGSTLDEECIKAIVWDMILGGTETTSTTLEWIVAAIIKNPDVMFKLQKEVREIGKGKSKIEEGDLVKMNYLKAVMKESMRLYITAFLLPREAKQDVKLMGYDISSGTQVLINTWETARDPSLWDNPEEFRPERFFNSPIDYKGLHYEYLPFGGGRRGCPGIQFAMAVNELAVANVVYKFDFKMPDGERFEDLDMSGVPGISLYRKYPLLVVATPHV